jgi:uncharacterized protein (DUF952 family)
LIAECFLLQENDTQNKVYFDQRALVVVYKGSIHRTLLRYPTKITLEHKKYVGLVIFGGLAATFCLLMIWNNLYSPWPVLIALLGAGLAFYYGWLGSWMLMVTQKNSSLTFPIPGKAQSLQNFARFFNQHQMGVKKKMIYHIANHQAWQDQLEKENYVDGSLGSEKFIHASEDYQIAGVLDRYYPGKANLVLLMIDALKLSSPIKYEASPVINELFPHIYGEINKDSIVGIMPLNNSADFSIEKLSIQLRTLL